MEYKHFLYLMLFSLFVSSTIFAIYDQFKSMRNTDIYISTKSPPKILKILNERNIVAENVSIASVMFSDCNENYCNYYLEIPSNITSIILIEIKYENENYTNIFATVKAPGEYSSLGNYIYMAIGYGRSLGYECYNGSDLNSDFKNKVGIEINVTKYENKLYKICVVDSRLCKGTDAFCYAKSNLKKKFNYVILIFPSIQIKKQYILKIYY